MPQVTGVEGDKFLSAITIKDEKGEQKLELDGVFIEIGWLPNTDIVDGFVETQREEGDCG